MWMTLMCSHMLPATPLMALSSPVWGQYGGRATGLVHGILTDTMSRNHWRDESVSTAAITQQEGMVLTTRSAGFCASISIGGIRSIQLVRVANWTISYQPSASRTKIVKSADSTLGHRHRRFCREA